MFINRFGTFVLPFLALHLTRLGYSVPQAGLALAAYGGGHLFASVLGGHLADTLGRRITIVLSMVSGAASMLCLSQAHGLLSLTLLAGLVGLTSELYKPAASALLGDLIPPADRVTAYAAYRFAINAGWAIGPATAGLVAEHSYFWIFAGDAATSLLFGAIAWVALPRSLPSHTHQTSIWNVLDSLKLAARSSLTDRRFVRFLAASFAAALVFMQMPTTFGLEVKIAGHTESVDGLLLALNGVLIVLFELPISTRTRLSDPRQTIAVGYTLIGCGFGLLALGDSITTLALGMTVFSFGEMISMPVAYAAQLSPDHLRGRYMGIYGLSWALALTLGPSLGMALFNQNPILLWSACAALGCLAAAIVRTCPGPDPQPNIVSPIPCAPEPSAPAR